jgi:type IV pilus assembly protein PilO
VVLGRRQAAALRPRLRRVDEGNEVPDVALNLSLNKLPWHAQVGVFVVISLAGAGAFWHLYARGEQEAIETRKAQLATMRTAIDRGLATAKRLPEFRREVDQLEAQLDRLRAVLPEERDVADLLRSVQAMATQSRLTIRGFTPRAVTRRQMHAEWPIGLQLEGTYHDIGMFLERVSKFPRIINVGDIHIQAQTLQSSAATVTADCTATTFVLLEGPAAPAAPAPGAPPQTE